MLILNWICQIYYCAIAIFCNTVFHLLSCAIRCLRH